MNSYTYGFRVVGPCTGERRLIDAAAGFSGYASCDAGARVESEAYLSAFQFGEDFATHLRNTRSVRHWVGPCWAPWLWWDIDRADDLERARIDAGRLAVAIVERFAITENDLLIFYSGSKGFHVGISTVYIPGAVPSTIFHRISRRFCETVATYAGVIIDSSVYDAVRCFRAPNSRHPKTGLHKRRLQFDALLETDVAGIVAFANSPAPFEIPAPASTDCDFNAASDWNSAAAEIERESQASDLRKALVGCSNGSLNRLTLAFIRDGAKAGDRHRLLYSAARNLSENGCPNELVIALLSESALDSGLTPADVSRQIDCGLKDAKRGDE